MPKQPVRNKGWGADLPPQQYQSGGRGAVCTLSQDSRPAAPEGKKAGHSLLAGWRRGSKEQFIRQHCRGHNVEMSIGIPGETQALGSRWHSCSQNTLEEMDRPEWRPSNTVGPHRGGEPILLGIKHLGVPALRNTTQEESKCVSWGQLVGCTVHSPGWMMTTPLLKLRPPAPQLQLQSIGGLPGEGDWEP